MQRPIYLDHHATTPLAPAVFEAMRPFFLESFGNPASRHEYGWAAAQAVEKARKQVADFLGCLPKEIYFTSGATESNNIALRGVVTNEANHVITSNIEHKSVLSVLESMESENLITLTRLRVNADGMIQAQDVEKAITPKTGLISLMFGNNEIGSVFPIKEIGKVAKSRGILFHTDATQAAGHLPISIDDLSVDMLSISAHKFHGPKGIGALFVRCQNPRVRVRPQSKGGAQEMGLRPGTINVPGVVGLGAACELAQSDLPREIERLNDLRQRLHDLIASSLPETRINGPKEGRLPHNLSLTFEGVKPQSILGRLLREVALSAGSACASGSSEPSHVLKAIGHDQSEARATLRFGLGRFTTIAEIERAAAAVIDSVKNAAS